ncbi:short-chain dehydrogenase [Acuticoccus sediminis]|uniref:Short-chain dehydrogenase n=1 Tax=Acuticoccus sediminis TaxID=2184697 RepID=A0A8B2NN45_9HYPH|nr:SDR family NAD(P)-dependent oxidoreductase [Acuticoccus sediminis]RAH97817.1 short-chain dehydrogenase [Acuticoccus sediminis]
MTGRLEGRRILVTGGASGIGLATVERFRAEGAGVAVIDLKGPGVLAADLRSAEATREAVTAAAGALGGLDGLVNAVGIDLLTPFGDMTDAEWDDVMAVNLTGPMRVCRYALPHMSAAGGTIVNVASAAGLSPLARRAAYCSSKAGLIMLGKTLAKELAPAGIRVNTVCPGAVDTPLFRTSYENDADPGAALEAIRDRYALHRVAEPHELADAILYLTSDESSYVTGTAFAVDGGRTFH